jgi:DNA-binding beta-propeller fold protein YncE
MPVPTTMVAPGRIGTMAASNPEWLITTVAGTGAQGYSGDGGPAAQAQLNNPFDLAFDVMGNLFFSDTFNHCIRRVDGRTHAIATIAGTGERGFSGDAGEAIYAMLNEPYGVVVDQAGTVYVADRLNRRVRRIEAPGIITTLAGDGSGKFSGDGGPAEQAGLVEPNGLALDAAGENLFIADVADHRVRVVELATGLISTFAGTGEARHDGDGGPATRAGIFGARAVALAPDGALYILERQGSSLRRVRHGVIETVAGTGARGYAGDGGDARQAVFNAPKELTVDADGNVFIVDTENHAIRRIDAQTWIVTTIAGTGTAGPGGDHGPARGAGLARPHGATVGPDGAVYIGDSENHRIRKLVLPH